MLQGTKTMDQHVQDFKNAARGSGYTGAPLVEEFKRSINKALREKLCNAESPPVTISQWYLRATTSDRQWRKTKAEEQLYVQHAGNAAKKSTGVTTPQKPQNYLWKPQTTNPVTQGQRDPNAMDIDRSKK
ncbi:hypothetical protein H0H92_002088, partial [Tricholoma furcatifolium]